MSFCLISSNVQSLSNKRITVRNRLSEWNPTCFAVQESWIKSQSEVETDAAFWYDRYVGYFQNSRSPARSGGGVCTFCRLDVHSERLMIDTDLDILAVRMTVSSTYVLVVNCYRTNNHRAHARYGTHAFMNALREILISLQKSFDWDYLVVCGDTNICFFAENSLFTNLCNRFRLDQLIRRVTHGSSAIDQIFVPVNLDWRKIELLAKIDPEHWTVSVCFEPESVTGCQLRQVNVETPAATAMVEELEKSKTNSPLDARTKGLRLLEDGKPDPSCEAVRSGRVKLDPQGNVDVANTDNKHLKKRYKTYASVSPDQPSTSSRTTEASERRSDPPPQPDFDSATPDEENTGESDEADDQ